MSLVFQLANHAKSMADTVPDGDMDERLAVLIKRLDLNDETWSFADAVKIDRLLKAPVLDDWPKLLDAYEAAIDVWEHERGTA